MDRDALAEHRKTKLQEFVDAKFAGNKAELGRALGYRDGAFVGQMLRGERPITEKTVDQIQVLPGGMNWFAVDSPSMRAREPDLGYPVLTPALAINCLRQSLSTLEVEDQNRAASLLHDLGKDPEGPWAHWLIGLLENKSGNLNNPTEGKPAPRLQTVPRSMETNASNNSKQKPALRDRLIKLTGLPNEHKKPGKLPKQGTSRGP